VPSSRAGGGGAAIRHRNRGRGRARTGLTTGAAIGSLAGGFLFPNIPPGMSGRLIINRDSLPGVSRAICWAPARENGPPALCDMRGEPCCSRPLGIPVRRHAGTPLAGPVARGRRSKRTARGGRSPGLTGR
jgi:hypothetical protein